MRLTNRVILLLGSVIAMICMSFQHANADEILKAYGIESVEEYGGLSKIHEDDRGVYYYGVFWRTDRSWNPNGWQTALIAFVKPRGENGEILAGDETMGTISYFVPLEPQPVFKLAPEEVDHFNAQILPKLRAKYPSFGNVTDIQVRYYALGSHFEDSEAYAKTTRLPSRTLAEQPLFSLGLAPDGQGGFSPQYQTVGEPGQWVISNYGTSNAARANWASIEVARQDRRMAAATVEPSSDRVETMAVADLYRHYRAQKTQRDAAAEEALRSRAVDYLNGLNASGYVYRNSNYWSRYDRSYVLRQIFNREYDRIEDPYQAASIYVSYLAAFYDRCETYLPSNLTSRAWYARSTDNRCARGGEHCDGFYFELHHDFYAKLDYLYQQAEAGNMLKSLEAIFGQTETWDEQSALEILQRIFAQATDLFQQEALMKGFLTTNQCIRPEARQLRENLLEMFGAPSSMSRPRAGSFRSDAPSQADIDEEIEWRKRQAERDLLKRSARPVQGPDGWPLVEEDFGEFTVLKAGDLDASMKPGPYANAVRAAKSERHPILYCRYGPTGLNGELPTWRKYAFWYGRVPPESEAIHGFDETLENGMLKRSATSCPLTTGEVERLSIE